MLLRVDAKQMNNIFQLFQSCGAYKVKHRNKPSEKECYSFILHDGNNEDAPTSMKDWVDALTTAVDLAIPPDSTMCLGVPFCTSGSDPGRPSR